MYVKNGSRHARFRTTTALTRTGNSAALHCQPVMRSVIWLNISVSFKTDNLYFYEKEFGICI
jgi:hypothetical protein